MEEQFSLDPVGRFHEARNIPCFNVLIRKKDNAPQATIDLVTKSARLPNHFLHHTETSEIQSKLPIKDQWALLYCYKELLSSTLCPYPIGVGNPLIILYKRGIPSFVSLFCCSRVKYHAPGPWVRWVYSEYCCYRWLLQICFFSKLLLEYPVHQSRIQNKFCQNCLFVKRQLKDHPKLFTVCSSLSFLV